MGIRFNMRAVPRSERSSGTLAEMVAEYTAKLQSKEYRWAVCVHEAAHAIYAEQFGGGRSRFEAPLAFSYDEASDSFGFLEAQVWNDVPRHWRDDAKHMLAGEVAEQVLAVSAICEDTIFASESDCGDRWYANAALKRGRVPKEKRRALVKRIESEIRRDLRDPRFRRAIERRAKEYQRLLERRLFKKAA